MRKLLVLFAITGLAACGGGGGSSVGAIAPAMSDDTGGSSGGGECSVAGQKQTVLDIMRFWYLWNDRLPETVNLDSFATPDAVLNYLAGFRPDGIPQFSFLTTAAADQAFFGEGQYEGYGFGFRFESADDMRVTRVFADSPAGQAGLGRGQRFLTLNGRTIADIEAAEGVDAVLDGGSVTFGMRELNGTEFTVAVETGLVTIDPVPQYRIFDNNGVPTAYIELETFISTADEALRTAFGEFIAAGVQDVIIDLRYNGGGLVRTAELLGDLLGGSIAQGFIFSDTRFNEDRSDNNSQELFELEPNSLSLARLVIIASRGTASASELVTNSMEPTSADVVIVGDNTFGKPVGQVGIEFCGQLIRPTAFQTLNGAGFGDYFDGLPADFNADDDLTIPIGADNDPNVAAALTYLSTGAWPSTVVPGGPVKARQRYVRPSRGVSNSPARVFADAN